MLLSKAIEMASKKDSDIVNKGFYLTSAITTLNTLNEPPLWNLIYFNPDSGKVISIAVDENKVTIGKTSDPLIHDHYEKLDTNGNLSSDKIIDIIRNILKTHALHPVKIIITLRSNKWRTIILTSNLKFVNIDIHPKTGEITLFELSNITKNK